MFRNLDSAFYFPQKAIREATDSAAFYYGKFYFEQCIFWLGHIDSSIAYYTAVENYFLHAQDSLKLMEVYSEKGNALKVISQYDKSYDYLMQAMNIAGSINSMRWQAMLIHYTG